MTHEPAIDSTRGVTTGPLRGIRIVDITAALMGPYATQTPGDMGADVIKVESPSVDVTRQIGPILHEGLGPVFTNANRSKRSIGIDLKTPKGKEALLRLIETADVFTYNTCARTPWRSSASIMRPYRR